MMLHILQGGTNSILNMAKFHHFVNLAESAHKDIVNLGIRLHKNMRNKVVHMFSNISIS